MPPLISIVLPTYNGSRFLSAAIQSCLDQTFRDWELIIVDDASTDATPTVVSQFVAMDTRIRNIRHEQNRKLPAALNSGFAQSQGEFLTWTSDDNLFCPRALETMVGFLNAHHGTDIVYSGYTVINENSEPLGHRPPRPIEEICHGNPVGCCFLYRRAVHEELGGYAEDLFTAEDYDFWLRAARTFAFTMLNEDLYRYRLHAASLTGSKAEAIRRATMQTLSRNLPRLKFLKRKHRALGYTKLAALAREGNQMRAARQFLLTALLTAPSVPLSIRGWRWVCYTLVAPQGLQRSWLTVRVK